MAVLSRYQSEPGSTEMEGVYAIVVAAVGDYRIDRMEEALRLKCGDSQEQTIENNR